MGFLSIGAFLFAADDSAVNEEAVSVSGQSFETNTDYFTNPNANNNAVNLGRASGVGAFLKMIVVLILVLVCVYAVFTLLKKNAVVSSPGDDPFLRRVSSVSLGNGKSVQIVTLLGEAYIVGVGDSSVNLLAKVSDKELIEAMNLYADKTTGTSKPRNFNDVLAIFMPNKNNTNAYDSAVAKVSTLMEEQRKRLNTEDENEL